MRRGVKTISIVCTDCKKDFVLNLDSIRQRVVCPICKQSDPLTFGSSNVAGYLDGNKKSPVGPTRHNHPSHDFF